MPAEAAGSTPALSKRVSSRSAGRSGSWIFIRPRAAAVIASVPAPITASASGAQ